MFFGQARQLCPNLQPIPYDFEAYHSVSQGLYDTVARLAARFLRLVMTVIAKVNDLFVWELPLIMLSLFRHNRRWLKWWRAACEEIHPETHNDDADVHFNVYLYARLPLALWIQSFDSSGFEKVALKSFSVTAQPDAMLLHVNLSFLSVTSGNYILAGFCWSLILSLIHIWRCRRSTLCRSRWSPYH